MRKLGYTISGGFFCQEKNYFLKKSSMKFHPLKIELIVGGRNPQVKE
jgi:hypothetical protein